MPVIVNIDDYEHVRWRRVGRTIYAVVRETMPDSDPLIGVMDSVALAEAVVRAHNAEHKMMEWGHEQAASEKSLESADDHRLHPEAYNEKVADAFGTEHRNPRWAYELFVDNEGSPETVWLVAEGRSAIEAVQIVERSIGLGDGFGVSMVYGVIEPVSGGLEGELRFRKVDVEHANETIAMWEVELA